MGNLKPPIFTNRSHYIEGLQVVELDFYKDERGFNFEDYNASYYSSFPLFPVGSVSISHKGVIRGFHGDFTNFKLVQCLFGSIFLAVIDTRLNSPTRDSVCTFTLSMDNPRQMLIPPGCVNGHQCLSEYCVFNYKLSDGYVSQERQIHIKWNDPTYNIDWPFKNPILSERDK